MSGGPRAAGVWRGLVGGASVVQGFLELFARLEVRLAAGGHVHDFAGARVARRGLGLGIFDLEDAKAPDFNAVSLDKRFAHGIEKAIDHLQSQVVFAAEAVSATDRARSFLVIVATKTSLDEELNRF